MLLTVEEDEYMPQVQSLGLKMVVHPQTAMPFPETEGLLLTPGFLTHVGITKVKYPFPCHQGQTYIHIQKQRQVKYPFPCHPGQTYQHTETKTSEVPVPMTSRSGISAYTHTDTNTT